MTKRITQIKSNGITYTLLGLPNSNIFKYEVVQQFGAFVEKERETLFPTINKDIFGISHLIEHMSFKHTKSFTSEEILSMLKKYGRYNASTNHDRVNYWYQTTMEHMKLAINLVNEIAFNDLTKVPENEFLLERDTVYNECKRYMDDDHTVFHLTSASRIMGLKDNDNVLGSLENISSLTLEDCIEVKKLCNMVGEQKVNVVFDNSVLTAQEIVDKIEKNIYQGNVVLTPRDENKVQHYKNNLPSLLNEDFKIPSESEQKLYSNTFEINGFDRYVINYATSYLTSMSSTSLFDEVREKRGLTYGIGLSLDRVAYSDYWMIHCDITKGNEEELLKAIKIACSETLKNFTEDEYNEFIETLKINRSIKNLNLSSYDSLTWSFNEIDLFKEDNCLSKTIQIDVDDFYNKIDKHVSYDKMKEVLSNINDTIQNDRGTVCWSS